MLEKFSEFAKSIVKSTEFMLKFRRTLMVYNKT